MKNQQAGLVSQADAAEAQKALLALANQQRRGIGFPILATCMPIIVACAVIISAGRVLPDQTGFAVSRAVQSPTIVQASVTP